jgi:26S proteasome regulatory subunit N1
LISASIHSDFDPALSLLSDQVKAPTAALAQAAIAGLGIAYAGHNRADVLELLDAAVRDASVAPQTSALAALSVGLVSIASCSSTLAESIVSTLLDRDVTKLKTEPLYRFFPLGLALLYLGTVNTSARTPVHIHTDKHKYTRTHACRCWAVSDGRTRSTATPLQDGSRRRTRRWRRCRRCQSR